MTDRIKQSCTSSLFPAVHPWLYCLVLGCAVIEWRRAFTLIVLVQFEIARYKSSVLLFFFVFSTMVTTINAVSTDSAINGKLPSNFASGVAAVVACGIIAIGNGSKLTPPTRDDIERANDCDSIQMSDTTARENKSKFPSTNNINEIANGSQSTPNANYYSKSQ